MENESTQQPAVTHESKRSDTISYRFASEEEKRRFYFVFDQYVAKGKFRTISDMLGHFIRFCTEHDIDYRFNEVDKRKLPKS